jgi:hypothetical protein
MVNDPFLLVAGGMLLHDPAVAMRVAEEGEGARLRVRPRHPFARLGVPNPDDFDPAFGEFVD